eukprot:CAMPEP_0197299824 /NCGR_PEP_ID=MMETSP0890-20130614/46866_1 /TAXON_ID=44058 ORGANISM="Aureoumbra lagunensis, Strain CCMP1510" /NCGR_SAMPLE_ID=MMETSP0890 /ASSEMBLY_ACC=CAM_ASM_000533 /LENGTH=35 /DNA_ID= /DNA_START= /DNA_END= /DNA_ORIENTATION=
MINVQSDHYLSNMEICEILIRQMVAMDVREEMIKI